MSRGECLRLLQYLSLLGLFAFQMNSSAITNISAWLNPSINHHHLTLKVINQLLVLLLPTLEMVPCDATAHYPVNPCHLSCESCEFGSIQYILKARVSHNHWTL
eukprot:619968_1